MMQRGLNAYLRPIVRYDHRVGDVVLLGRVAGGGEQLSDKLILGRARGQFKSHHGSHHVGVARVALAEFDGVIGVRVGGEHGHGHVCRAAVEQVKGECRAAVEAGVNLRRDGEHSKKVGGRLRGDGSHDGESEVRTERDHGVGRFHVDAAAELLRACDGGEREGHGVVVRHTVYENHDRIVERGGEAGGERVDAWGCAGADVTGGLDAERDGAGVVVTCADCERDRRVAGGDDAGGGVAHIERGARPASLRFGYAFVGAGLP